MLAIDPRIEFDLSKDIKIRYVSQIEESTKALKTFHKILETLALTHKKVLEENIKLNAKIKDLNAEVNSSQVFDQNNLLNTNVFAENPIEEGSNCFQNTISTPLKNQSQVTRFGSPVIGKSKKSLNNKSLKLNDSQNSLNNEVQVLENPISDNKNDQKIPDYSLDLFETQQTKSNGGYLLGISKNIVTKDKKLKQTILQFKPKRTTVDLSQLTFNDKTENKSNKENFKHKYMQTEDELINLSIDPSSSRNKSRLRLKFSDTRITDVTKLPNSPSLIENCEEFSPVPLKRPEVVLDESVDATYFPNYKAKEDFDDDDDDDFQDFRDHKRTNCAQPPAKKYALDPYDCLPDTTPKDPSFVYQEKPVRKKTEKQKLNGYDCEDCRPWYELMSLCTQDKQKLLKKCSKHRGKFEPKRQLTPESFWNPLISGSSDEDD